MCVCARANTFHDKDEDEDGGAAGTTETTGTARNVNATGGKEAFAFALLMAEYGPIKSFLRQSSPLLIH